MAKLSEEQIIKEITDKGFTPVDISKYKNVQSKFIVRCENNHLIETDMLSFRKDSFRCAICHGSEVKISNKPPQKKGYRVIALDNATQNMGVSVFDDGELVYYSLIKFTGPIFEDRLEKIFRTVIEVFIDNWQADFIVFEDIQFQNNYQTYKKLAMLLGLLVIAAKVRDIKYEIVAPSSWRSHYQITGQRQSAKLRAINLIKQMYNVDVVDDIAEAILLGKYITDKKLMDVKLKKAF